MSTLRIFPLSFLFAMVLTLTPRVLLAAPPGAGAADDLAALSDEFDSAGSLGNWQRNYLAEGWEGQVARSADPWNRWLIDGNAGEMVVEPNTGGFFRDFKGGSAFKMVTNDVVVTVRLRVTGRDGVSPVPRSTYSLGGILLREPQTALSAADWVRGREDYLFLALGHGTGNIQQWEVKDTRAGSSELALSPAPSNEAIIQIARIGNQFICLRFTASEGWRVHARFNRTAAPFPAAIQVGLTAYTDWPNYSGYLSQTFDVGGETAVDGVWVHNTHSLTATLPAELAASAQNYDPDIIANFDYYRFARPDPAAAAAIAAGDIRDTGAFPDAQLLAWFGANANPAPVVAAPVIEQFDYRAPNFLLTLDAPATAANPTATYNLYFSEFLAPLDNWVGVQAGLTNGLNIVPLPATAPDRGFLRVCP